MARKYLAWLDAANTAADASDWERYNELFVEHWGDPEHETHKMGIRNGVVIGENAGGYVFAAGPEEGDLSAPFVSFGECTTRFVVLSGDGELCVWTPEAPAEVIQQPAGTMLVWPRKTETRG